LLGSGGKVFEVVEDEQEQAPEVAAEFYPASANGPVAAEGATAGCPSDAIPAAAALHPATKPSPAESSAALADGNGSGKPTADGAASSKPMTTTSSPVNNASPTGRNGSTKPPAEGATPRPDNNNGNGSVAGSGFNQLRNEFLTAARRVATTKK